VIVLAEINEEKKTCPGGRANESTTFSDNEKKHVQVEGPVKGLAMRRGEERRNREKMGP
jgi:hypothetical protein